jgi:hypothetical protein
LKNTQPRETNYPIQRILKLVKKHTKKKNKKKSLNPNLPFHGIIKAQKHFSDTSLIKKDTNIKCGQFGKVHQNNQPLSIFFIVFL